MMTKPKEEEEESEQKPAASACEQNQASRCGGGPGAAPGGFECTRATTSRASGGTCVCQSAARSSSCQASRRDGSRRKECPVGTFVC